MARRASKVDRNQPDIVGAFRKAGASVFPLHMVGDGCPDLLIGYMGANYLVEVKDGDLVPSAQKLRPKQVEFHDSWRGQVCVVNSVDAALALLRHNACKS